MFTHRSCDLWTTITSNPIADYSCCHRYCYRRLDCFIDMRIQPVIPLKRVFRVGMMHRRPPQYQQIIVQLLSVWTIVVVGQESNNSTPSTCQDLLTNFASCVVSTFDLQSDAMACDTCRLEYAALMNNSTESLSCNDIETIQCTAVKECPCHECSTVLESYWNCEVINKNYNGNPCPSGIDCRTSTVNCENSFDEYRNCIYRLPITTDNTTTVSTSTNGKACDKCRQTVATQFSNGGACEAAQTNFCIGVNATCATVWGLY